MEILHTFPAEYRRITHQVARIKFPAGIARDDGFENVDFFVTLNDGRTYSFTGFTPRELILLMDKEGLQEFVSPGLMVFKTISVAAILAAVEHWLLLAEGDYIPLAHFGILQKER